jgi:hypothetical protein
MRQLGKAPHVPGVEDLRVDLEAVLDYLDEQYSERPGPGHICTRMRRLRQWLESQKQFAGYDLRAWDRWNMEAREVLGLYGVDASLFTHDQLVEALEREGRCGAGEVIQAVKYGANYPVRRPAPRPS